MTKSAEAWTEAELAVLAACWHAGAAACAERLPGRSVGAIRQRARIVGLTRVRQAWLGTEIAVLQREYPVGGVAGCAAILTGRSAVAIYQQAHARGLAAPPYPSLKKAVAEAALLRQEVWILRSKLREAEARLRDRVPRSAPTQSPLPELAL
jgi:hypothetical protein